MTDNSRIGINLLVAGAAIVFGLTLITAVNAQTAPPIAPASGIATLGTLEPYHLYLIREDAVLLQALVEADASGEIRVLLPPDGHHTWEFELLATPTPAPLLYPTLTPSNTVTPTPTETPTATPYPTMPMPPPTPVWRNVQWGDIWDVINAYTRAQQEYLDTKAQYEKNGWPTE